MASSWREQQKDELRQRLYEIALDLFRTDGYEATTVLKITEAAGVGKGTFHNHFFSKEQVLAEWYRTVTLQALQQVRSRTFNTALEAVCGLTDALSSGVAHEPQLFALKARRAFANDLLSDEENQLDRELLGYFREHVAAGKAEGSLDPGLDEELFTGLILAILTGTGHEWVLSRPAFDLEEALRARLGFLFTAARSLS